MTGENRLVLPHNDLFVPAALHYRVELPVALSVGLFADSSFQPHLVTAGYNSPLRLVPGSQSSLHFVSTKIETLKIASFILLQPVHDVCTGSKRPFLRCGYKRTVFLLAKRILISNCEV